MSHPSDDVTRKILERLELAEEAHAFARKIYKDAIREVVAEGAEEGGGNSSQSNPHDESYRRFGVSRLAAMLFMDIVDYSRLKFDEEQREAIESLIGLASLSQVARVLINAE